MEHFTRKKKTVLDLNLKMNENEFNSQISYSFVVCMNSYYGYEVCL